MGWAGVGAWEAEVAAAGAAASSYMVPPTTMAGALFDCFSDIQLTGYDYSVVPVFSFSLPLGGCLIFPRTGTLLARYNHQYRQQW